VVAPPLDPSPACAFPARESAPPSSGLATVPLAPECERRARGGETPCSVARALLPARRAKDVSGDDCRDEVSPYR
jgi:hypothetical protein